MNKVQQAHVETLFYVWVWQKKIKCEIVVGNISMLEKALRKNNGSKRAWNHRSNTSEEEANFKVEAIKQRIIERHTKPTKVWNQLHFVLL
jgi:hypothetical protein